MRIFGVFILVLTLFVGAFSVFGFSGYEHRAFPRDYLDEGDNFNADMEEFAIRYRILFAGVAGLLLTMGILFVIPHKKHRRR